MIKRKGHIEGYHDLKRHCNELYSINNKDFKIGDLTDMQLEIALKILNRKDKLTQAECRQLDAVKYIINYRSGKALEKLIEEVNTRIVERALKAAAIKANSISLWGEKVYNTNEYEEINRSIPRKRKEVRVS